MVRMTRYGWLSTLVLAAAVHAGCVAGADPGAEAPTTDESSEAPAGEHVAQTAAAFTAASWSQDYQLAGAYSWNGPSAAGTQCVVHQASDNNGLWSTYPGANTDWSLGQSAGKPPALTGKGGTWGGGMTYMVHNGGSDTNDLWFSASADCKTWVAPWMGTAGGVKLPFSSITGVALALYGGKIVMAHTGNGDYGLRFTTYDPLTNTWSSDATIPGAKLTPFQPALAHYNGKLYLAYNEIYTNNIWTQTWDGTTWTAPAIVPGVVSNTAPAIAAYGGALHMVHLANGSSTIMYTSFNGTSWAADQVMSGHWAAHTPSIAPMNDDGVNNSGGLIMVHDSNNGTKQLWYATLF